MKEQKSRSGKESLHYVVNDGCSAYVSDYVEAFENDLKDDVEEGFEIVRGFVSIEQAQRVADKINADINGLPYHYFDSLQGLSDEEFEVLKKY